jgi:hypothetical protein
MQPGIGHTFRFAACQFGQKTTGSPLNSLVLSVANYFARLSNPVHVATWVDNLHFSMRTPPHPPCDGHKPTADTRADATHARSAPALTTGPSRPRPSGAPRLVPSTSPCRTGRATPWLRAGPSPVSTWVNSAYQTWVNSAYQARRHGEAASGSLLSLSNAARSGR